LPGAAGALDAGDAAVAVVALLALVGAGRAALRLAAGAAVGADLRRRGRAVPDGRRCPLLVGVGRHAAAARRHAAPAAPLGVVAGLRRVLGRAGVAVGDRGPGLRAAGGGRAGDVALLLAAGVARRCREGGGLGRLGGARRAAAREQDGGEGDGGD